MTIVLLVVLGAVYTVLVLVRAMSMPRSAFSMYELERRAAEHDSDALRELKREAMRPKVMALHRLWESVLISAVCLLSIAALGWFGGIGLAFLLLLVVEALASLTLTKRLARLRWPVHEKILVRVADKYPKVVGFLGEKEERSSNIAVHSKQELISLLQTTQSLTEEERSLTENALSFSSRFVKEVMTPRKEIVSISKEEILGPLALTAIHKTKHSHLPVAEGGLDRVIGTLVCAEVMNTERQEKLSVGDVMRHSVHYLHEDQTLYDAVQALLRTRAHLFIVVDSNAKTVGIITFSDVTKALFGQAKSGSYHYEDKEEVARLGAASFNE